MKINKNLLDNARFLRRKFSIVVFESWKFWKSQHSTHTTYHHGAILGKIYGISFWKTYQHHLGIWIHEKIAKSRFASRSQIWTQIWPPADLQSDYRAARVQIWDLDDSRTTPHPRTYCTFSIPVRKPHYRTEQHFTYRYASFKIPCNNFKKRGASNVRPATVRWF